jgi:hypothetical protein
MSGAEWIRRSPRFDARCSKRHGGCGDPISPSRETCLALPPNGKRVYWHFLCGRCALKLGILPQKVGAHIEPDPSFVPPAWRDK